MLGVLTLAFDPVLALSGTASVRFETIALALVLFIGLALAVRVGRLGPGPALRTDDLIFMVVGAVPGAVVGGRIGYVLDHWSYYQVNPGLVADPAQGGFTITLAIPLGILTGAVIGRLLGSPIGRWMHALAVPLLFVLATGKLAGVLGGTGQGAASDLPWATAYTGPGPWGSLAAEVPSHPSQVYEAIGVALAIVALSLVSRAPSLARRDGGAMWAAIGLWCVVRLVVGFSWRDPAEIGFLRTEQALAVGVGVLALAGLAERARAHRKRPMSSEPEAPSASEAPPDSDAAAEPDGQAEAEAPTEADAAADPGADSA